MLNFLEWRSWKTKVGNGKGFGAAEVRDAKVHGGGAAKTERGVCPVASGTNITNFFLQLLMSQWI